MVGPTHHGHGESALLHPVGVGVEGGVLDLALFRLFLLGGPLGVGPARQSNKNLDSSFSSAKFEIRFPIHIENVTKRGKRDKKFYAIDFFLRLLFSKFESRLQSNLIK